MVGLESLIRLMKEGFFTKEEAIPNFFTKGEAIPNFFTKREAKPG